MIKSYFKIALRGFRQHKLFTFINIMGLSIGISAALVIFMIAHFDLSFNQFPNSKQLYRVVTNFNFDGMQGYNSGVSGPVPVAMRREVTGLVASAPIYSLNEPNVVVTNKGASNKFRNQKDIVLTDAAYFKLFPYTWLAGRPDAALSFPNQVVLTSTQAQKYFPTLTYNQMLGHTISYDSVPVVVSGIVKMEADNTDFTFHDFISLATAQTSARFKERVPTEGWTSISSATQFFVQLTAQTDPASIEKQVNGLLKKYKPKDDLDTRFKTSFALQPLADLHFNFRYGVFGSGHTASKNTLYGLVATGIFLLLLACINFINLTTAQGAQRSREIGVRKTMGSTRTQLILQFLSETFLLTVFSVIVAMALSPLLLRVFADFIPQGININFLQPSIALFLVGLTLVVTLLSGFYPALVLSGYGAVKVLKNQTSIGKSKTRTTILRKSLTVTQFVIAQFFIIAMLIVSKQIHYALNKDLGFKKDAIVMVGLPYKERASGKAAILAERIRRFSQVQMVSIGTDAPAANSTESTEFDFKDGKTDIKTNVELKTGDPQYLDLYQIRLIAGRKLLATDSGRALLVNETYAKAIGFKDPAAAVDKSLSYDDKIFQIAGVVADFRQGSLHSKIPSMAVMVPVSGYYSRYLHIALKPQSSSGMEWGNGIDNMRKAFEEIYPEYDFDYRFVDDSIAKFYTSEQHTATLLTWATALSVFISCLGLLGLAMYTTSQRTKEIGVRKVLGASVTQIVSLLSREMVILVLLAFVVVVPVSLWAAHKWMESFADRTEVSWWIFALSGAGMLLAAFCTLSFQTIKAALMNPVKSLRSE